MAEIRYIYSDVNLHLGVSSSKPNVYDEDSINQSILTILGTPFNTRAFRPAFGSGIYDLLFEPMDDITASKIRVQIINAIDKWEARVILGESTVVPDVANQQYYCELSYLIPSLNNKFSTFTFNLAAQPR